MSIYIVARFHAKSGCEESLRETLLAVVEPTRAEPGCLEIHVYRALRDQTTFFIHSAWTSEQEFEKHGTLPHVTRFLSQVIQWIDHEVQAVRCDRLA